MPMHTSRPKRMLMQNIRQLMRAVAEIWPGQKVCDRLTYILTDARLQDDNTSPAYDREVKTDDTYEFSVPKIGLNVKLFRLNVEMFCHKC